MEPKKENCANRIYKSTLERPFLRIAVIFVMHLRHSEHSEESSYFLHRILVILLPLLRHFERSEKSSYFSFRNTRLYWMFRGYASQHDAKRFGVRMTAKTFRVLVILSTAKGPVISRFAIQDFTGCFEAMPLNMTLNASASE